jgi:hypothetical protein
MGQQGVAGPTGCYLIRVCIAVIGVGKIAVTLANRVLCDHYYVLSVSCRCGGGAGSWGQRSEPDASRLRYID